MNKLSMKHFRRQAELVKLVDHLLDLPHTY